MLAAVCATHIKQKNIVGRRYCTRHREEEASRGKQTGASSFGGGVGEQLADSRAPASFGTATDPKTSLPRSTTEEKGHHSPWLAAGDDRVLLVRQKSTDTRLEEGGRGREEKRDSEGGGASCDAELRPVQLHCFSS